MQALRSAVSSIRLPRSNCMVTFHSRRCPTLTRSYHPPRGEVKLLNDIYRTDAWTNITPAITDKLSRRLHLTKNHPLCLVRQLIESHFAEFKHHNNLSPIVTTAANFDSLGFPLNHPGRSRTDTYYVNERTVLRTHTSAHQADSFRELEERAKGFTITADVYRRDAIDRSHYPVFHQMEGARIWNTQKKGITADWLIKREADVWPENKILVEDTKEPFHRGNPKQPKHHPNACYAVGWHLKKTLEQVFGNVFELAKKAQAAAGEPVDNSPLRVRWVDAYFPFTSPSWELEVFWKGEWLEMLGCGVVKQEILDNNGKEGHIGWAFGLGLERLAMVLYNIPDIRLFWSQDRRFLDQFSSDPNQPTHFREFSKYPVCYKDVSFWLPTTSSPSGGQLAGEFHENDFMELVRGVVGDMAEDVRMVDSFTHPKTGRRSLCYRINYRALDRTLTNLETNDMHEKVKALAASSLGVELR